MLSLAFDINAIHASSDTQTEQNSRSQYIKNINPIVDTAALLFGLDNLKTLTSGAYGQLKTIAEKTPSKEPLFLSKTTPDI